MTFEGFLKKYAGMKVDADKMYGAQCVDLFRQYCTDVWNVPHTGSVEGAKDLYLNYDKLPLEKKYFSLDAAKNAVQGDVVIWGATDKNKYGHVAIYVCNIGDSLLVFEQDGFKQDGAKFSLRSKENVLGIIRKKKVLI